MTDDCENSGLLIDKIILSMELREQALEDYSSSPAYDVNAGDTIPLLSGAALR
jgi:hypothetical protein